MSLFEAERAVHVEASPERVWALVGDPTNIPRWSPECVRVEWLGGATAPAKGARFRGWNRIGPLARWSLPCRIDEYADGSTGDGGSGRRELTFRTSYRGRDATMWSYRLAAAADDSTELTLACDSEGTGSFIDRLFRATGRQKSLERNIERSLRRIKELAEA